MTVLIIGNGAAATAAVEAFRARDRKSRLVQLTHESSEIYSRCLLPYYIADALDGEKLVYRGADFHRACDVELHAGGEFRVIAVDAGRKEVACDGGARFAYDKLLLCTGSSARRPAGLPRAAGIHVLRDRADAEALRDAAGHATRAVVLGGGLVGVKAATALRARGLAVTMIVGSGHVLSQMIDAEAGKIVAHQLASAGVSVEFGSDIAEVQTRGNAVHAVRTDRGTTIPCEMIVLAKGVSPNIDMLESRPDTAEGLRTDAYMRTSMPGIWAAGDVAAAYDIVTETHAVNALWTCAVQQGRVAGASLSGGELPYNGAVGMNSLTVGELPLIAYGQGARPPSTARVASVTGTDTYRKLVIGADRRIKGVILLGRIANAGVLLSLIRRRVDVSGFADELLDERFDYGAALRRGGDAEIANYRAGAPA